MGASAAVCSGRPPPVPTCSAASAGAGATAAPAAASCCPAEGALELLAQGCGAAGPAVLTAALLAAAGCICAGPTACATAFAGADLLAALPACMAAYSAAGEGTWAMGERLGAASAGAAAADGWGLEESDGWLAWPPSTGVGGMQVPAASAAAAGSGSKQAGVASPDACSASPCMPADSRCPARAAEELPLLLLPLPPGLAQSAGSCTAAVRLERSEVSEARADCCARSPCCSCAACAAAAAAGPGDAAELLALLLGSCRSQPSAAVAGSRAAAGSWRAVAAAPAA